MSHLIEQQKETALNAQYAIKTALAELSEMNHLENDLYSLDDGLTIIRSVETAINELRMAKSLCDSIVDKATTCNTNFPAFPAASTTNTRFSTTYDVSDLVSLDNSTTFRIIHGMSSQLSHDEQTRSKIIIELCQAKDNGTLQFSDDNPEYALYALMALALHDELAMEGK